MTSEKALARLAEIRAREEQVVERIERWSGGQARHKWPGNMQREHSSAKDALYALGCLDRAVAMIDETVASRAHPATKSQRLAKLLGVKELIDD